MLKENKDITRLGKFFTLEEIMIMFIKGEYEATIRDKDMVIFDCVQTMYVIFASGDVLYYQDTSSNAKNQPRKINLRKASNLKMFKGLTFEWIVKHR